MVEVPPVTLLIKPVSGLCNLRCKYCFYADVMEQREMFSYGKMDLETLELLVQNALEYAEDFVSFGFQGGEPTLAGLDFYEHLVAFERKYNTKGVKIQNSIQTNGYAIDKDWAQFLHDHQFLAGLSMDGTAEIHDSLRLDVAGNPTYQKAAQAAELFEEYKVEYNILCVVTNFTARYPRRVFSNLKPRRFLQFIPCLDSFDGEREKYSLAPKRYGEFLKQTFDEYYRCLMQGEYVSVRNFDNYIQMLLGNAPENCAMNGKCASYFLIEGDGSVFPCDFYVLDQWKMGNIKENSFQQLYLSETAAVFRKSSEPVHDKCQVCKWYPLCRGGCRRDREPFVHGKPGLNRLCESYLEFFPYAYPKMERIAKMLK
ncbi:anaerobic sulfatase maturase [Ructibacterium gallinarum]|uniref:Anaerobic sulfatase maturase n=1 Tax=Ructibacterium gallinarum TaxID=2779355 RepID=A0A9D5M7J4_9FIRM|nr:anaerobic sulfatase maturase [Ructibacterium gallinarum]MBE5040997.1 anaerobic sulfatase maturase [Ructibacterium gallinarum]